MRFCSNCRNITIVKSTGTEAYLECRICSNKEELSVEDRVLSSTHNIQNISLVSVADKQIEEKILGGVCSDDVFPRIKLPCPKDGCDNDVLIFIRTESLRKVFICCKCNFYWEAS